MNTLTDLLLGVGQPRVSHFPDLCTLLYTYLSTLDYWTKIVYYLFTQTSPVANNSALTPTYMKSQKLPNWPISKELGLGRMLLPHWKLLLSHATVCSGIVGEGTSVCHFKSVPTSVIADRLAHARQTRVSRQSIPCCFQCLAVNSVWDWSRIKLLK